MFARNLAEKEDKDKKSEKDKREEKEKEQAKEKEKRKDNENKDKEEDIKKEDEDVIVEKEVVRGLDRRQPSILAKAKVSRGAFCPSNYLLISFPFFHFLVYLYC